MKTLLVAGNGISQIHRELECVSVSTPQEKRKSTTLSEETILGLRITGIECFSPLPENQEE